MAELCGILKFLTTLDTQIRVVAELLNVFSFMAGFLFLQMK